MEDWKLGGISPQGAVLKAAAAAVLSATTTAGSGMDDDNSASSNDFCSGMGMIMYMDGFQWTLKRQSSCLNFYFPQWKLDSTGKFMAAMLCVLCMGIFTEGIGRLRHDVNRKARRYSSTRSARNARNLWYIQTALQGANALMAYILMLATMTFSLEILCCVILGLMIGYFVFGGDLYNHAGSVCCQFLEDEEDSTVGTMTGALLNTNTFDHEEREDVGEEHRRQDNDNNYQPVSLPTSPCCECEEEDSRRQTSSSLGGDVLSSNQVVYSPSLSDIFDNKRSVPARTLTCSQSTVLRPVIFTRLSVAGILLAITSVQAFVPITGLATWRSNPSNSRPLYAFPHDYSVSIPTELKTALATPLGLTLGIGSIEHFLHKIEVAAAVTGATFLVLYWKQYKNLPMESYKPGAAWMRALIYFSFCNLVSAFSGTMEAIVLQPIATAAQLQNTQWLLFCGGCFSFIFVAYWILWARMTLTFDRKFYIGSEVIFGLCWGLSVGQLLLSFYHIWNQLEMLPQWGVYLAAWCCQGLWQYLIQSYFWDIYVSPEHDTPRSIILKTACSHVPNVILCLAFLSVYNNYLIFVALQTFGLVAASIFQKFPAPWVDGDFDVPRYETGILGLPMGVGWVDEETAYEVATDETS